MTLQVNKIIRNLNNSKYFQCVRHILITIIKVMLLHYHLKGVQNEQKYYTTETIIIFYVSFYVSLTRSAVIKRGNDSNLKQQKVHNTSNLKGGKIYTKIFILKNKKILPRASQKRKKRKKTI